MRELREEERKREKNQMNIELYGTVWCSTKKKKREIILVDVSGDGFLVCFFFYGKK